MRTLKGVLLSFAKCIGLATHYIVPQQIVEYFHVFTITVNTYKYLPKFKKAGNKIRIGRNLYLKGAAYISIDDNVSIGNNMVLTAWDKHGNQTFTPEIVIGNNTQIGRDCHITAIDSIKIGDNVLMGMKITITDNSHGKAEFIDLKSSPSERHLYSRGEVVVGNSVWIGDKATILPGVKIGENSIIGANSVVTKDVPRNCVVVGNPARIIKNISER